MVVSHAEPTLLGQGGYGCAFMPALPCLDPHKSSQTHIGKVFDTHAHAYKEYTATLKVRKIDPRQKFFLYPSDHCKVASHVYKRVNARLKENGCWTIQPGEETSTLSQLLVSHGGMTLRDVLHAVPLHSVGRWEMIQFLERLFYGVRLLSFHGLAHQDIKPDNIVYSSHKGIRLIDWGLMRSFKRVFDVGSNPLFLSEQSTFVQYPISPPEYRVKAFLHGQTDKRNVERFVRLEKHMLARVSELILTGNVKMSYGSWFDHYQLGMDRFQDWSDLASVEMHSNDPTTSNTIASKSDVYSLGMLLLLVSPWLKSQRSEPLGIVPFYERLVRGMLHPNPYMRMSIDEVIQQIQNENTHRKRERRHRHANHHHKNTMVLGMKTPDVTFMEREEDEVLEWMKGHALFPEESTQVSSSFVHNTHASHAYMPTVHAIMSKVVATIGNQRNTQFINTLTHAIHTAKESSRLLSTLLVGIPHKKAPAKKQHRSPPPR